MRRFTLIGMALALLTGSASAQSVVNVTVIKDCKEKMTIITPVPADRVVPPGQLPKLDQLGYLPLCCPPTVPLCCLLPDQPALLYRIALLDRALAGGIGGAATPKLDEIPRPKVADQPKVEEKKDGKEVAPQSPLPTTMVTLVATDWQAGRCFTDDCARRWSLVKGCALPATQPHMRGWLLESDGKKLYFLHESGNVYTKLVTP